MRSRFIDLAGGLGDSCRGDGGGRSIYACVSVGETVQVPVTDMSIIFYQSPNANYGTVPGVQISFATGFLKMGVIQTDLSTYNGRTVLSATINVLHYNDTLPHDFTCYEIWREWAELEVTYNDRLTGVAWETPGIEGAGDRDSVAADVVEVELLGWYAWDVTAMVTAWLSGTRTNYGLRLWPEILLGTLESWDTDDRVDPAKRPYFELTLA